MKRFVLAAALAAALCACEKEPAKAPPVPPVPTLPPPPRAPEPGADPGQRLRAAPADALIAFARGAGLWVIKPDGTDGRLVVKMEADVVQPAWSPNRKWIAFSSASGSERNLFRRNLFLVRPDGSDLRQVTPLPRSGENLENAPKGLVRGRAVALGEGSRVGVKDFDVAVGGRAAPGKTQAGGLFEVYAPAGSSWIKVSGTLKGVRYSGATMLFVHEGRVAELREILLTPEGADDEAAAPFWAADGLSLYFLHRTRGACSLDRIALDGADRQRVFSEPSSPMEAAAATPDGGAILKMRDGRLLKINLESQQPVQRWEGGFSLSPAVAMSPDGGTITFTRTDEGLLTHVVLRNAEERTAARGSITSFDFSPDGRSLVYAGGERGSDLFILDLATGASRPLTNDGKSSNPAWYGR